MLSTVYQAGSECQPLLFKFAGLGGNLHGKLSGRPETPCSQKDVGERIAAYSRGRSCRVHCVRTDHPTRPVETILLDGPGLSTIHLDNDLSSWFGNGRSPLTIERIGPD